MYSFKYQRVGSDLINELHHKIINNESIVLLGPRYGGKRYVMDRLSALLPDSNISPIIRLRLLSEPALFSAETIPVQVGVALDGNDVSEKPGQGPRDPLDPIKSYINSTGKPVVLFAANVDGMAHHIARRFLEDVQTLIEEKKLVAIISAETDLRDLVTSRNDGFNCAHYYVLKGFELQQFSTFVSDHLQYYQIEFADLEQAARDLWEVSGGNLFILRVIIWSIIQQRSRLTIPPEEPVTSEEIPRTLKLTGIPGAYGAHIFRHATQSIARDAPCWTTLEQLISKGTARVQPHAGPTRLELAGIATRNGEDDDARLSFSSPIMQAFIEQFYDTRRFGDLYAGIGDWDNAFDRYEQLPYEDRVRPSSVDDRAEVEAIIGVLCFSLYAQVAGRDRDENQVLQVETVKKFFAKGCHYVLGFHEITFWQRDTLQQPPEWICYPLDVVPPATNALDSIQQLLPSPLERNLHTGIIESIHSFGKHAVVAALPSRLNKQLLVVVSDFTGVGVISHERRAFVNQLLSHFIGAYKHAVEVENLLMRHRIGRQQDGIIDSIFEELGRTELDVRGLLTMAARKLRQFNYSRVLFCMVDKERRNIKGVVDDADNCDFDVVGNTNWPLNKPTADLQPYVIHTKQHKIVTDAQREPLANKRVAEPTGMHALAIVPILTGYDEAIGTIHVERMDGAVPSIEETDDLMFFGRQLAIAIDQCERSSYEHGAIVEHSMKASSLPAGAPDTDSAIIKILQAMEWLGHKWARLYLAQEEEDGDTVFISKRWHGRGDGIADVEFNSGKVILARRSTGHWDWRCIEEQTPVPFCWIDSLDQGEKYISPRGLEMVNWKNPVQPRQIQKEPGDYWLDFPLIHQGKVLGKICLQSDSDLTRLSLDRLRGLSANFSATLAANLERDREKGMIAKSVADKTLHVMAHNVGTRLGSLPVVLYQYRNLEKEHSELASLNDKLSEIIAYAQNSVKRVHLGTELKLETSLEDLPARILDVLQTNLSERSWKFNYDGPALIVQLDRHLFETALLEMIQNSRELAPSSESMRISINLEATEGVDYGGVTIVYTDNGPGVPDEFRELIFQDFFSYRPKQRVPNLGLGMGFVRRVMEAHGGHIYTRQLSESDLPGAKFVITLPCPNVPYPGPEENDV